MSNWNRKYRPTSVDELHLKSVREQLQSLFTSGIFPQALLFAGPKGTGKTSASRIIGATLNDPNNAKSLESIRSGSGKSTSFSSPDLTEPLVSKIFRGESYVVNEMDAASNRGIDDVRQLKERVALPPQEGSVSVYILDEAHMLTTEAFNALLKVLEEPPSHAIFILATTEMHKIPATVLSRCQVIQFHKASPEELSEAISNVLESEKIPFDEAGLTEIILQSDGSFRDAIKLAEHASRSGAISTESVRSVSSGSLVEQVQSIVTSILNKDAKEVVTLFSKLRDNKVQQQYLHQQLLEYLHDSMTLAIENDDNSSSLNVRVCTFLLQEFSDEVLTYSSPIPLLPLELKALEIIARSQKKSGGGGADGEPVRKSSSSTKKHAPVSKKALIEALEPALDLDYEMPVTQKFADTVSTAAGDGHILCTKWEQFAELVANENSTVAALIRSAKPISGEHGSATIRVYYSFHQEQLQGPKIAAILSKPIAMLCGGHVSLTFIKADVPETADVIEVSDSTSLETLAAKALL